jgi:ribosomal protein S18 acetylase RimI-like enzyme
MSPKCRTQIATLADLPRIVMLMEQYWDLEGIAGFAAPRAERLLKQVLSRPQLATTWVAHDNREIVGYLIAVFVLSFEYQGLIAEIDELFVLPGVRRRGIGAALLDTAEASLAEAGCTYVQLQLGTTNDAARAFYYRRGYASRIGYELLGKHLADE